MFRVKYTGRNKTRAYTLRSPRILEMDQGKPALFYYVIARPWDKNSRDWAIVNALWR